MFFLASWLQFFPHFLQNQPMTPKTTHPAYESGEGIVNMRRLLNGLHRPRAGLNTSIFFEEGWIHSLGLTWTSRVLISMENNMPKTNWFTYNPYSTKADISSSKWSTHRRGFPLMKDEAWAQWVNELKPIFKKKWINNGIYELIMLSKVTVVAKPELLTIALLFWNTGPTHSISGWVPWPQTFSKLLKSLG